MADLGLKTFVETTVAIALAQSWAPLVKSKARAAIMMIIRRRGISNIFQHCFFNVLRKSGHFIKQIFHFIVGLVPFKNGERVIGRGV